MVKFRISVYSPEFGYLQYLTEYNVNGKWDTWTSNIKNAVLFSPGLETNEMISVLLDGEMGFTLVVEPVEVPDPVPEQKWRISYRYPDEKKLRYIQTYDKNTGHGAWEFGKKAALLFSSAEINDVVDAVLRKYPAYNLLVEPV